MDCVKVCNFCFQEDLPGVKSVESFSTEFNTYRILDIVTKHFWFTKNELAGFAICPVCWDKLSDFHSFYCQVEQQWIQDRSEHKLFIVEKLNTELNSDDEHESKNMIIKTEKVDNEEIDENVCDIDQEDILNIAPRLEEERHSEEQANRNHEVRKQTEEFENQNQKIKRYIDVTNQDILQFCQIDCKDCSESFVTFKQLNQHYSTVHNQRGYVTCCKSRFYEISRLRDHIRVHMNPATFHCSECKTNFSSKRCLFNHRLLHQPDEQKTFSCELCPKKFTQRYKLNTHMLGHKNVKDFPCQNCDKKFTTRDALASHFKNIHDRANEVMCDVCSKILKTRSSFLIHRAEHFNTKRIQCSTCGKWMKNEQSLRMHMIRHREESKVFVCDTCGKQSPNSHALRKHIQDQHTMERIHQCTLCEKSFKRALVLKEHMATHTGQRLYSCTHCGKEFKGSANLYTHRKKAHPVEWQEYQKTKPTFMSSV
ncbi:gastrula zinc finger protein XlCGF26.1-like [Toxorhynchites rutilus septentrionalis]|uniref:gastrula zinc finger protein XlCGF26.1-like n=1 Tax=Toxorhynchites rutilus septentrionalis TaxID=329112 RepID=UPI00247AB9FB|nr:gastrula zinc finger protein XlCGF26.1-like [Toxorhynchites rutilus septentrionalis]